MPYFSLWYAVSDIEQCDILKIADNEIKWLIGKDDYDEAVFHIKQRSGVKLINVTLGKEGSIAYYDDKKVFGRPFLNDKVEDATGAGDTFCGSVLRFVLENGLENLSEKDLEQMLLYANAAASIVTTRKGAICSMPEKQEIESLLTSSKL